MTPEEARARLKNKGRDLTRKERKALNTIASMTTEYSVQLADGELVGATWGTYDIAEFNCEEWRRYGYNANIAVRYVTAPQPLGEEQ